VAAGSGRATLYVALSACAFASIPIFVSLAVRSGTPLVDVLIGRYGLAAVLLGIIAWATGTRRLDRGGLRVLAIVGVMQAAVAYTSLLALEYIPAGTLSFLFYTYPAWIAIIARVRHSEPLTLWRLLALALSLGGVLVMVGSPSAAKLHPTGVALALSSAVLYAVYVPLVARVQRGLAPAVTAGYMAGGAALVFYLAKVASGAGTLRFTAVGFWSSLALAVISTTIAFLFFLRGLRVLGPVRTGIVSTIEPFATALLGAAVLAQPLSPATVFGGVLIAAAVILLQLRAEPTPEVLPSAASE
jgi:drug/metabolite transporter (DMT)-like permease